jgi:hypothetical protein
MCVRVDWSILASGGWRYYETFSSCSPLVRFLVDSNMAGTFTLAMGTIGTDTGARTSHRMFACITC